MKLLLKNSILVLLFLIPFQLFGVSSIEEAYRFLSNRQYVSAKNAYLELIKADSCYADAYIGAIESSLGLKQIKEAESLAKQAQPDCNPNHIFSRYLGYIYYLKKDYYRSIYYYKIAIWGSMDRSIELTGLGKSYSELHYLDKAENYLLNALKVNKDNLYAQNALNQIKHLPLYTEIYSGINSSNKEEKTYFGSLFINSYKSLLNLRFNHFESNNTNRDSYALGYKYLTSGWKTGIDLAYMSGDYKLLYDTYGTSLMFEKEFINQYGYNRLGYSFSYCYYDILSSIQNTAWYETKINRANLLLELTSSIRDYEVKDLDNDYWLLYTELNYRLPYNFTSGLFLFYGDKEFYVSPKGYVIDNYREPNLSYGFNLMYELPKISIAGNYTINDDKTYSSSLTLGYKTKF